ncbi:hypothetical protein [Deinococcus marmoris]|uniref:hypothetical protein n=1 Tax=Deinococcus marmoris TaxID=249408 RepID=UPI00049749FA|nr:hypothetical protein [Deinococcus marmoris]
MTNLPLTPQPSPLNDQLNALIISGNPGAVALRRITWGRPVPPHEQLLAIHALLDLLPQTVIEDIDTEGRQVRVKDKPFDPTNLPSMSQALGALMPGSPHLPWACQVLNPWIRLFRPPAEIVQLLENDRVWDLAPAALARARRHNLEGDLDRPFRQVDRRGWIIALTGWTQGPRALRYLHSFLNCDGRPGALHWLASEGARRERFES